MNKTLNKCPKISGTFISGVQPYSCASWVSHYIVSWNQSHVYSRCGRLFASVVIFVVSASPQNMYKNTDNNKGLLSILNYEHITFLKFVSSGFLYRIINISNMLFY